MQDAGATRWVLMGGSLLEPDPFAADYVDSSILVPELESQEVFSSE